MRDLERANSELRGRVQGLEQERGSFEERMAEVKESNEELMF